MQAASFCSFFLYTELYPCVLAGTVYEYDLQIYGWWNPFLANDILLAGWKSEM